jgi:predicted ester cyclase
MSEENKDLVRRSWATDNPDDLDETYTPDAVWHLPEQELRGVEEMKQYVTTYITAFPDLSVTVEDEIAEGEKVVERFTLRGTHQGETEEFGPPTGRQIELKGMTISRIEGGKIVEEWQSYANSSRMDQLGLAPER